MAIDPQSNPPQQDGKEFRFSVLLRVQNGPAFWLCGQRSPCEAATDMLIDALVARGKTTCVTSSSTAKQPLATA